MLALALDVAIADASSDKEWDTGFRKKVGNRPTHLATRWVKDGLWKMRPFSRIPLIARMIPATVRTYPATRTLSSDLNGKKNVQAKEAAGTNVDSQNGVASTVIHLIRPRKRMINPNRDHLTFFATTFFGRVELRGGVNPAQPPVSI
jgi:hypothetical protein